MARSQRCPVAEAIIEIFRITHLLFTAAARPSTWRVARARKALRCMRRRTGYLWCMWYVMCMYWPHVHAPRRREIKYRLQRTAGDPARAPSPEEGCMQSGARAVARPVL